MKNNSINITEEKRTISSFLNSEYKDYVHYVLENRALPSIVDGFKTGARKIMHAAFTGSIKNGNIFKLLVLSGDTMKLSLYAHGDGSLNGTIVTLGQTFNYNLNPLDIIGQSGSLRDPGAVSSARYLSVKLSKYFQIWKYDYDLLNFIEDEGEKLEPEYYLPIIPTVLAQNAIGMAPGYRFSCMSYNPVSIIDACLEALENPDRDILTTAIKPYSRGLDNKKYWKFEDGHWVSYGDFEVDEKKDTITVTAFPYTTTFEGFEKLLNKLIEKGDIKDWKNYSEGEAINYQIKFNKDEVKKQYSKKSAANKVYMKFKLKQVVPDDSLWVLDENKNIKHFLTPHELVRYFVDFRLTIYDERKKRLVKVLNDQLKKNDDLIKFITLICNGKLKIRNRSKKDIKVDMDGFKLPMELVSTTPFSKCTIEERDELMKQNEDIRKQVDYVTSTTTKQMYLNDLNDLRKNIEKDFK